MTLYERSYSFSDPNWSDDPVVENDEGTRTHLGQVRSAGQQYIAVIIREITDTENTIVKVISKDATEKYEVTVNESARLWDVNDNGEVLLYTETVSNGSTTRKLICLSNTGSVKWSVDLGSAPNAIEIGTDYAGIVTGSNVQFFSVADGSEVKTFDTGYSFSSNGDYQQCYGSADGFTLVYKSGTYTVVFANADGDYWHYNFDGNTTYLYITGRDIHCGRVSVWRLDRYGDGHLTVAFRTGEHPEKSYRDEDYPGVGAGKAVISPCGEWVITTIDKIYLYYVTTSALNLIREINYASGQSGQRSIDLSFYGKYVIVLHNSDELYAYQLKDGVVKDNVSNPLQSRAVMVCSD